eukprot:CAMPEP_0196663928 /NCGR_PEP_ID=MMETSP1086-20130531/54834_1 /TAXON_ID=77921 /ORGANISM="Cyanoptyche  gloeocystis , Strain SAG4.97" /LENGTH=80 /DNA_ID=CAMNT_0041999951 /DNA_START=15 /DNA_END=254 /DNA_ORIENTATION=+
MREKVEDEKAFKRGTQDIRWPWDRCTASANCVLKGNISLAVPAGAEAHNGSDGRQACRCSIDRGGRLHCYYIATTAPYVA